MNLEKSAKNINQRRVQGNDLYYYIFVLANRANNYAHPLDKERLRYSTFLYLRYRNCGCPYVLGCLAYCCSIIALEKIFTAYGQDRLVEAQMTQSLNDYYFPVEKYDGKVISKEEAEVRWGKYD